MHRSGASAMKEPRHGGVSISEQPTYLRAVRRECYCPCRLKLKLGGILGIDGVGTGFPEHVSVKSEWARNVVPSETVGSS